MMEGRTEWKEEMKEGMKDGRTEGRNGRRGKERKKGRMDGWMEWTDMNEGQPLLNLRLWLIGDDCCYPHQRFPFPTLLTSS